MQNNPFTPSTANDSRLWGLFFGTIMVLIGLGLLASKFGLLGSEVNWWALLIALPGLGFLANALATFRLAGNRLNYAVVIQGLLSLAILSAAVSAFFGISLGIPWGDLWPIFLVLCGLSILSGVLRKGRG